MGQRGNLQSLRQYKENFKLTVPTSIVFISLFELFTNLQRGMSKKSIWVLSSKIQNQGSSLFYDTRVFFRLRSVMSYRKKRKKKSFLLSYKKLKFNSFRKLSSTKKEKTSNNIFLSKLSDKTFFQFVHDSSLTTTWDLKKEKVFFLFLNYILEIKQLCKQIEYKLFTFFIKMTKTSIVLRFNATSTSFLYKKRNCFSFIHFSFFLLCTSLATLFVVLSQIFHSFIRNFRLLNKSKSLVRFFLQFLNKKEVSFFLSKFLFKKKFKPVVPKRSKTFLKKKITCYSIFPSIKINFFDKSTVLNSFFQRILCTFNLNHLCFRLTNLNLFVQKKFVRNLYSKLKKFQFKFFARRFGLFIDFLKTTTLFNFKKISVQSYLDILTEIFRFLSKRAHTRFFFFLIELFDLLLKKNSIGGFKFVLNGKIRGKNRSKTKVITCGRVPIQTFDKIVSYGITSVRTVFGVFGLRMWVHFLPSSRFQEKTAEYFSFSRSKKGYRRIIKQKKKQVFKKRKYHFKNI